MILQARIKNRSRDGNRIPLINRLTPIKHLSHCIFEDKSGGEEWSDVGNGPGQAGKTRPTHRLIAGTTDRKNG